MDYLVRSHRRPKRATEGDIPPPSGIRARQLSSVILPICSMGSNEALIEHGVGDFYEARDVGAGDKVA